MRIRFATYTLDADTRQLLDGGTPVHLSPKAFDVLSVLIEARPKVVSKGDLHDRIWPGTFVVDANLSVLIGEIRRALGDSAQTPRFVRTVHKIGYAFCGDAAEGPAGIASRADDDTPRCWLAWGDKRFMLEPGDNLIGRNPESAIWIDTGGVSRRHARVRVDAAGGAAVEDLNSTNGTFVNDVRVAAPRVLADGDVVQVASVPLTFRAWRPERARSTERIRRR